MLDSWLTAAKDGRKQRDCIPWEDLTLHFCSPIRMMHVWLSVWFLRFSHLYISNHVIISVPKEYHVSIRYISWRLEKIPVCAVCVCVYTYIWVYVYMCTTCTQALWGCQRRGYIPWNSSDRLFVGVMCILGIESVSSEREVSIQNHWV